jgi:hypothetical protein
LGLQLWLRKAATLRLRSPQITNSALPALLGGGRHGGGRALGGVEGGRELSRTNALPPARPPPSPARLGQSLVGGRRRAGGQAGGRARAAPKGGHVPAAP